MDINADCSGDGDILVMKPMLESWHRICECGIVDTLVDQRELKALLCDAYNITISIQTVVMTVI